MASLEEKAPAAPHPLKVNTRQVTKTASNDTIGADTLTTEKNAPVTVADGRVSDVSSPRSAQLNPFDTDVEAMITPTTTTGYNIIRKTSTNCPKGGADCQVWPGRDHWKNKAKAARMKRSFNCLGHLSRRNRILMKCLIVILIVGIAIGVGVGISKPLGAPMWKSST